MSSEKKVDHTNVFESYIAQDVFVLDILEKIADDWKRSHKADSFNRNNFEEFICNEFVEWLDVGMWSFCDEEFGEEEDEDE